MNKRYKELAEQATETVKCGLNGTSTTESFNRKKFAELIVRECAELIESQHTWITSVAASALIRKHFGVEE